MATDTSISKEEKKALEEKCLFAEWILLHDYFCFLQGVKRFWFKHTDPQETFTDEQINQKFIRWKKQKGY